MGEIAEALKKANAERELGGHGQRPPPDSALPPLPDSTSPTAPFRTLDHVLVHVERHRHLALRIRGELESRGVRSLAIVSALRNEGKTTVACNIAAALASLSNERSVALVDLDLRNPSLAGQLGVAASVGVESVLLGRATLEQVLLSFAHPALDVYAGVDAHKAAHELLVLPAFAEMLRQLEARYSTVIIDTPPTLIVPDSTLILRRAVACLAVARAGETRVSRFQEMLDLLPDGQLIGKILNHTPAPKHRRDAYYYDEFEEESS